MAMSRKHFEAMSIETANILCEIKAKDKTLTNHLRSDAFDIIVRVIQAGTSADTDSRFDATLFRNRVWGIVAQRS